MARVHVVGSGPSGLHMAQTLLDRGIGVTLLDVGQKAPDPVRPDLPWSQLKEELADPVGYFLGDHAQGLVLPEQDEEVYGFPPGRDYIFDRPRGFEHRGEGFEPLFGFSRGGLAEAWTGGCYPFSEGELRDFPFDPSALFDAYGVVAGRIGVSGDEADDLGRFYPLHNHLSQPLRLDEHSALLLERYRSRRGRLNRAGIYMGRTRVATLTQPHDDRPACSHCGRCLWGCPTGALYTPGLTLERLQRHPDFEYRSGVRVLGFTVDGDGQVQAVEVAHLDEGGRRASLPVQALALAAGALGTSEIVLRSWAASGRTPVALPGLMDNRQVLVPFLTLSRVGASWKADRYQYHVLGMGMEQEAPRDYVHCQVTTLGPALMHPVIQKLPFPLAVSARVGALLHGALGLVNVNYADDRRDENTVSLEGLRLDDPGPSGAGVLTTRYTPSPDEPLRLERTLATLRRGLRALGCIVPPWMVHARPMGASVHYAGTLPMTTDDRPLTTDPGGRLRPFRNVWVADGASFPFLPAKNLTFTLMANATRVARGMTPEL